MGVETINKHVRAVKAVINSAKNAGHISFSPAQGVADMKATALHPIKPRRPFAKAELDRIFAHPLFAGSRGLSGPNALSPGTTRIRDDRFWVPILLLLTGARSTEIAGLKVSDVIFDGLSSRILIQPNELRRLKNEPSKRVIPIPKMAFDLGIEQFVLDRQASGDRYLFPMIAGPGLGSVRDGELTDATLTARPTMRQFHRTILKQARVVGATAHSFRHAYEDNMTFAVSDPEMRARLTGRAIEGSRGEYTHNWPKNDESHGEYAAGMRKAVDQMTFTGVNLDHLKPA